MHAYRQVRTFIKTYKNRVNCFFYSKVGACRHGEKCTRIHNKPMISSTIMFRHLYQNPPSALAFASGQKISESELKEVLQHFEKFYEEIFVELSSYGELKELEVVDNLGDHLIGNVYARFNDEAGASKAFNALAGKYYNSKLVEEEYCNISKISWCKCRFYEENKCKMGPFCNYLHLKPVSERLLNNLREEMYEKYPEYKKNRRFNFFSQLKKHEHSASESSLEKYDCQHRQKIIKRWNEDYFKIKKIKNKEKKNAQAKIDLAILQQKLKVNKNYEEDFQKIKKNLSDYGDSDETISKNDL